MLGWGGRPLNFLRKRPSIPRGFLHDSCSDERERGEVSLRDELVRTKTPRNPKNRRDAARARPERARRGYGAATGVISQWHASS